MVPNDIWSDSKSEEAWTTSKRCIANKVHSCWYDCRELIDVSSGSIGYKKQLSVQLLRGGHVYLQRLTASVVFGLWPGDSCGVVLHHLSSKIELQWLMEVERRMHEHLKSSGAHMVLSRHMEVIQSQLDSKCISSSSLLNILHVWFVQLFYTCCEGNTTIHTTSNYLVMNICFLAHKIGSYSSITNSVQIIFQELSLK